MTNEVPPVVGFSQTQKVIAEFLGTMFFTFVIGCTEGNQFIPMALFINLIFFGSISGGHFNPAVTVTQLILKNISLQLGLIYMIVQCFGAFCATALCYLITQKWAAPVIDLSHNDLAHIIMKEFVAVIYKQIKTSAFMFMILMQTEKKTQITTRPILIYFLVVLQLYLCREISSTSAILNPAITVGFQAFLLIKPKDGADLSSFWILLVIELTAAVIGTASYIFFTEAVMKKENKLYDNQDVKFDVEEKQKLIGTQV